VNVDPKKTEQAPPLRVAITGGAGQISYSLAFLIARGYMLGAHQPVILHLLDVAGAAKALNGVAMELQDCAFPLLRGVVTTADVGEAFAGVHVVVMVGAFPRKAGMQRADLLAKNCAIFKAQGEAIAKHADPDVRVLVVGNPANTNAVVLATTAQGVPKTHVTCMTRLDHNRSKAQMAERLGVAVTKVHNVIVWGNHSSTQYPDVRFGHVVDYPRPGIVTPLRSVVNDDEWLRKTFVPVVQQRGAKVIEARKLSSAASAATAACDHVRDWLLGTPRGEIVSMGVHTTGQWYGVRRGLIYSLPVTCSGGEYHVVEGLPLDEHSERAMRASEEELAAERAEAFTLLGIPLP
jgi:malate dehydrogenase